MENGREIIAAAFLAIKISFGKNTEKR